MASTFDALLRLELQQTGENANTWGEKTNTNLELIADAIAGSTSISIAGTGDYTLSTANAAIDQARKMFITLTGVLTGARAIIVPSNSKVYVIYNNTSGAFAVTVKTASGVAATVPQGYLSLVVCNGTDCFAVNEVNRVSKAGDTMTGALTLPGDPTNALHAATKGYVDAATGTDLSNYYTKAESDAKFLDVAGDTMTGFLTLNANPTSNLHAATKQYVDGLIGGSTIPSGVITMWSGSVFGVPAGWALCNGANGTPDLRDRFVIGAGSAFSPNATGGTVAKTTNTVAGHNHAGSTAATGGSHSHGGSTGSTTLTISQIPSHDHAPLSPYTQFLQGAPFQTQDSIRGLTGSNDTFNETWFSRPIKTATTGGGGGHTHTISTDPGHTHSLSMTTDGAHSHTIDDIRPPFLALAYIMKL
jgi:hypothetical protein